MIHIISGGTTFHIRPHLALCAPAYGGTGRLLQQLCGRASPAGGLQLHQTRMAGGSANLDTNLDVQGLIDDLVVIRDTKIIFMPVALCDFDVQFGFGFGTGEIPTGKDQPRLKTSDGDRVVTLTPAAKVIQTARAKRKDIFLVGFKTTTGDTPAAQFRAGLGLLKTASCNLVLANDLTSRLNMVITPEQAVYHQTYDRYEAIAGLVDMTLARSKGTFTRSTVVPGDPVPWSDDRVPDNLRKVVDHLISRGAYKTFHGSTVGHFAVRLTDSQFLTSRRKTDFNRLADVGLVLVTAAGDDRVIAVGSKPSVGGQSQRIVFADNPGYDCIVHAHVPVREHLKAHASQITRSQRPHECGSHQCGQNTSNGLRDVDDGIKAVMLDNHGPNVVFRRDTDPQKVIAFLEGNFDLTASTAGFDLEERAS